MLNLDTHIVIYAVTGLLRAEERDLLEREAWAASAMVIWEIEKLALLRRMDLSPLDPELRQVLDRITIIPVTAEIAATTRMLDFHSDPCDEIISATSVITGHRLLTRDRKIRASAVVPLALR